MTPANKGSVIERPAGGKAGRPDEGPSKAQAVVETGSRIPVESRQGSVALPEDSDLPPEILIGEAVPLHERLIVAPCCGRFQAGKKPDKSHGEYILEGQEIGRVLSINRETVPVKSAFSGWIMGYLVPEGSPVREAEPVAWLRPH